MTTVHCLVRAKERLGINAKYAERFIENGIERGKSSEAVHRSEERRWLENRCGSGKNAVLYNGCCLIVSEDHVCITIFSVPKWFGKQNRYDGKEKIRNAVKYHKFNIPEITDIESA